MITADLYTSHAQRRWQKQGERERQSEKRGGWVQVNQISRRKIVKAEHKKI